MKGFLTFLVLKLISQQEMSGDEIRDELERRRGTKPSPGTIYPVLKQLSEVGLIEEVPDGGKIKKYRMTRAGNKEVKAATEQFVCLFQDMKKDFEKN